MRIAHQDGVARSAFCWGSRPAVRATEGVVARDYGAGGTAGGKAARHFIGFRDVEFLPGRNQCREIVLAWHGVEMDNVLNSGSDVSGDEGQYPKERRVDRNPVGVGIFVLPFGKGLDDGGLLVAAGF